MKNYLVNKILDKYENSNADWKNRQSGNRSIKIQQKDYDELQKLLDDGRYQGYSMDTEHTPDAEQIFTGKECLLKEACWLEARDLIKIDWLYYKNDIREINYSLKYILDFYKIVGREPKYVLADRKSQQLHEYQEQITSDWIKQYYQERIIVAENGKEEETEEMEGRIFRCLSAIEKLQFPIYIRTFSSKYLGDSKLFETKMKTKILSIARKYHPFVDEVMEDYQVYEQLYLDTYSQELALKGNLNILLEGREVDLSLLTYGTVLNSETLKKAEPVLKQRIKKIITVENKANFVSMPYEEGTLILFTHGFFSPLERNFLKRLAGVLGEDVSYFHTGDLDYGGIRIFQYIRREIFPKLQPFQMSVEQYKKYEYNAMTIETSTLEKLKKIKEPLLQDLIDLICEKKKVIEQESFLIGSLH